jgi:hypothetical protein
MTWICGASPMTSDILWGMVRNSLISAAAASSLSAPVRRPRWIANSISAASCVVNALVEATPISGPACVYNDAWHMRGIELSTTLAMHSATAPCFFASLSAANVSAVSPDCEIASTTSPLRMIGSR